MGKVTVLESTLTDIADAIRDKLHVADTYKPSEMADAISDIGGGVTPTGTKQVSITANGTTTEDVANYANAEITVAVPASAVDSGSKAINSNGTHDVVGYASASVSVPNSYSASDEGKVVSNGSLVAQTSSTVTQNDTYDTTLINSLTVDAPVFYMSPETGTFYQKIMDITLVGFTNAKMGGSRFPYCHELEELTIRGMTSISSQNTQVARNCDKLKKVCFPDVTGNNNSYMVTGCGALEEVQIGSIGNAKNATMYGNAFSGCTNNNLVITIYVADSTTIPFSNSPFGATNATVVYRSATTGEVRTP